MQSPGQGKEGPKWVVDDSLNSRTTLACCIRFAGLAVTAATTVHSLPIDKWGDAKE